MTRRRAKPFKLLVTLNSVFISGLLLFPIVFYTNLSSDVCKLLWNMNNHNIYTYSVLAHNQPLLRFDTFHFAVLPIQRPRFMILL